MTSPFVIKLRFASFISFLLLTVIYLTDGLPTRVQWENGLLGIWLIGCKKTLSQWCTCAWNHIRIAVQRLISNGPDRLQRNWNCPACSIFRHTFLLVAEKNAKNASYFLHNSPKVATSKLLVQFTCKMN